MAGPDKRKCKAGEFVNNIEEHISNIDDINKYDIISDTNYNDIINVGDKIEIKKNDIHKVTDSYYSEPLTSPVKRSDSPILNNEEYLHFIIVFSNCWQQLILK